MKAVNQDSECGITGAEGFTRSLDLKKIKTVKRKKKRKKRVYSYSKPSSSSFCQHENSTACNRIVEQAFIPANNSGKSKTPRQISQPSLLTKRKLGTESFYPAFSTKNVFCRSKFRNPDKKEMPPSFKIIDGTESPIHAFPWMVSLQYKGSHFCGGSLITDKFVITAAHCMEFGNIRDFLEQLTVRLGEHDLSQTDESPDFEVEIRKVVSVLMYWRFSNRPGSFGDVAMIELDSPVGAFTRAIRPVCLPYTDAQFERMLGVAAGWGLTEDFLVSEVLRQVELNIIPNVTCVDNLGNLNVAVTADMICTFKGPTGTESICSGDSGGPLMVRLDGKLTLAGITSFSVADCTAPFPSVFSRVTYFMRWIEAAIVSSDNQ